PKTENPVAKLKVNPQRLAGFTEEELAQFSKRFQSELWPLFTRNKNSCVSCHDDESDSQLHMADDADMCFKQLLVEGRLDPKNSTALLGRITINDKKKRMPKSPSKP